MDLSKKQLGLGSDAYDRRAWKRGEIKVLGGHAAAAREKAFDLGFGVGCGYHNKPNRFPAGARHNEYERGVRAGTQAKRMGRTASCWN